MLREIKNKDLRVVGLGSDSGTSSPATETVFGVVPLGAGEIQTDDVVRVRAVLRKGIGFNSAFRIELYWNTASTLNGSEVQLATYTCSGSEDSPSLHRVFVVKSSSTLDIFGSTTSRNTSLGEVATAGSTVSGLSFGSAGYFIISVIRTTSGRSNDNITLSYISVEI